ncbi:MAG TPA: GNAT family N-acetyltransferase [Thermoanaerobaculia bacterium]|nr:GNAT family N-acetyltransferase [Thermoanaerobaculia bacterium]
MLWRASFGGKRWKESLGEPNREAFRELIASGQVHGALAFRGTDAIGWCSIGPRIDFPGLTRKRLLQTEWDPGTWSVTCFYMPSTERGKGLASALLRESLRIAREHGASSVEAYPVRPKKGEKIPAAFAWTGVPALFEREGFEVAIPNAYQPVYRKRLV